MKICRKRPLAEKSRWRHIRLAIKPRYLRCHASQIKSYHGIIIGSHVLSFRICHKKLPKAPPSGEITMMTSYPPCNKTSLPRKPCIPDIKLPCNTIRKSWSFRICCEKTREAPLVEEITMTLYLACKKPRYLKNQASQIKSYYWSLSWSLGRLVNFIKKTANIN